MRQTTNADKIDRIIAEDILLFPIILYNTNVQKTETNATLQHVPKTGKKSR